MVKEEFSTSSSINEKYDKFFQKFDEINSLDTTKWSLTHVLAYFCKKYKDHYGTEYKFKFNTPSPSKCFEVFQIKRLSMLLSADPETLKEYVDWVFESKVKKAKRKWTSISFLTNEQYMNFYKMNVLFNPNCSITRTAALPEKYKNILNVAGFEIETYGDLAFLNQMTNKPKELSDAFHLLESIGFDQSVLSKVV